MLFIAKVYSKSYLGKDRQKSLCHAKLLWSPISLCCGLKQTFTVHFGCRCVGGNFVAAWIMDAFGYLPLTSSAFLLYLCHLFNAGNKTKVKATRKIRGFSLWVWWLFSFLFSLYSASLLSCKLWSNTLSFRMLEIIRIKETFGKNAQSKITLEWAFRSIGTLKFTLKFTAGVTGVVYTWK